MTIEEVFKAAEEAADKWWNTTHKDSLYQKKADYYRDMMQDLRAIGRTDEEIWHEFITGAFIYGFCEAHKDIFDKEKV
jgi:ABC-type nickel/cobalt efflux system permease component RcnA